MRTRKYKLLMLFVGCLALCPSCALAAEDANMKPIVAGNTTFAYNVYANLRNTEGNLFFSPYSISTALAMTFAGARGGTEKQMAQTLHFTLDQASLHPAF